MKICKQIYTMDLCHVKEVVLLCYTSEQGLENAEHMSAQEKFCSDIKQHIW